MRLALGRVLVPGHSRARAISAQDKGRLARPKQTRRSRAGTISPRRLISPQTAGGASGTGVMARTRRTSWTCSISRPRCCPAIQQVQDLTPRVRHHRVMLLREARGPQAQRALDVEQLRDWPSITSEPSTPASRGALDRRPALDDVEELVDDDSPGPAVDAVDHQLQAIELAPILPRRLGARPRAELSSSSRESRTRGTISSLCWMTS
nr:hypothetical protein [Pseudenhygromyxa sp. WMMC2535]